MKTANQHLRVEVWAPMSTAEVEALPPLPGPALRGWAPTEQASQLPAPDLPEGVGEDSTHAYVFRHPQEAAAVLRTLIHREECCTGPLAGLIARQVGAIFLIALGREVGSRVVACLDEGEVEEIVGAVAQQGEVTHELGMHAMEQVRQRMVAGDYAEAGGAQYARNLLERALGPYRAYLVLNRTLHPHRSWGELFAGVAPEQIAPFLSQEHPQVIALTLSQLKPAQAAGILTQLPERMQADVAYRIATLENVTPTVLEQIEESLESSLRDILGGNKDVGGPKVVADILNLSGASVEKKVLGQMDAQDPEVAESVRNLMFVFADIVKLTDHEIQTLLREVDQKDLVVALKAAEEELKVKILNNMSEQVRTFISEEMEFLGPMRLREVEEVQLRIVQQVRQLEEKGQITVVRGVAEDIFV